MEVIREPRMVRFVRWLSKAFIFFFFITILTTATVIISLLYLRSQPLPSHHVHETTTIYAADGQIVDTIHQGQNRTYVPIEQMPTYLLQAAISVEDQRFFEHYGVDLKRIVGAMIVNIKQQGLVEGASTITQQLARNLYLNHDKTWQRKLQEVIYTLQLEMHYSKSQILEKYLNQIYFGHSAYGVESAAQHFFGKSVNELSLAEAAMIAGIPKGPKYYSPFLNEKNAKERQELILSLMEKNGYITEKEKEDAIAEELHYVQADQKQQVSDSLAPYFRDYVKSIVVNQYGIKEELFEQGGLRIYTTLDPVMQQKAEKIMKETLPMDRELQGALVAIDPRTGYIKAMIGGKDHLKSPYNRAFADRQPGSSIKPFLYYTALEEGLTPLTLMKSEPTVFTYDDGRATYTPRNFNDSYPNDYITMERAIAKSDNIYAVKTIQHVGADSFIDVLNRLGLNRPFKPLPSLALGAQNVSLFEMVRGYTALASGGTLPKPIAVTRIEDRLGNTIVEVKEEQEQVLDPDHVFILNRMMRSVFEPGGTGYRVASEIKRPAAGKTGSTDTDSWMIGFTPQLVAGVWVGYDQGRLINHNNDGKFAAQIWAKFLEGALEDQMPALFPVPEGLVSVYINPDNGKLATDHCPVKKLLYFKSGTEPKEYCMEHLPEPGHKPKPVEVPKESSIWDKVKEWWD